jgi:pimeloyl-ACP methyl ester carboxylesterase
MGGMFTQLLAVEEPGRLDALVLMDTHHGSVPGLDWEILELGIELASTEGMDPVADIVAVMGENDPLATPAHRRLIEERPDRKAQSDRNLRVASPAMYAAMLRALPDQVDRLERLSRVPVRTLVIVGEQDRPFLEASERMAETIPDARLVVIPDAGHSPQLEAPDAWWKAMSEFLDEVADA